MKDPALQAEIRSAIEDVTNEFERLRNQPNLRAEDVDLPGIGARYVARLDRKANGDRGLLFRQYVLHVPLPRPEKHVEAMLLLWNQIMHRMDANARVAALRPWLLMPSWPQSEKRAKYALYQMLRMIDQVGEDYWRRDFSIYRPLLADGPDRPAGVLVEYLYDANVAQAIRLVMDAYGRPKDEQEAVIEKLKVVEQWRANDRLPVERRVPMKAEDVGLALDDLARSEHWWVRLYAATCLARVRLFAEYRNGVIHARLRKDQHPIVQGMARWIYRPESDTRFGDLDDADL
jgi:hypothetical protein